jgi:hypothetical protein
MSSGRLRPLLVEHPLYGIWKGLACRCDCKTDINYYKYGARGIKLCDRWRSFGNFLVDMGPRPKGTTLDRIDNDGNYEPGNCRWATIREQTRNTRANRKIEFDGRSLCITDWATELGIHAVSLRQRIKKFGIATALTMPRRNSGPLPASVDAKGAGHE